MQRFEMCVESDLSHLAEISEFVAEGARHAGLSEDQVFEVQMAADEACTNSIEHAYNGTRGEVRICCWTEASTYVVRITDFGAPFDPSSVPVPDPATPLLERGIGGLGIFFMRELVDQVEFTSDPVQGNQVVLRKQRHSPLR